MRAETPAGPGPRSATAVGPVLAATTSSAGASRPAGRSGGAGPPRRPGDDERGEGGHAPRRRGWRRVRRLGYLAAFVLIGLPIAAFVVGWIFFRVPTVDDAANNQVATIAYADGAPMARLVQEQGNRIKVPIEQVPLHVQQAVLAAEDRTFYSNLGFDPMGIARAAWNQARGGTGGGSTITQQYVKNVLVGNDYSLWRKYREVVIAAKISQEQSKEEILGNYLNTIYFGRGAYGIQAASQAYFGRDVATLTPSEGAMLAGVIQAPSRWDPAVDRDRSVQRWNFVLDGMVSQNWLPPAERSEIAFPETVPPRSSPPGVPANDRGHIVTAVRAELTSYGITEQQVNQEGLQITTTIDPRLQDEAVEAAENTLRGQPDNLRTALVATDPRSGAVRAYYGGTEGSGFDYARAERQPGSSFKPFVLMAGLERNPPVGLGTRFDGSSPQTIAGQEVTNSEGEGCPDCDLRLAMTRSINTVFYQLGVQVGPGNVAEAARQAGISAELPNPSGGIALGDKEVRPGDMATAYATFAADGLYHRPHMVTRVTTADGRVLYDAGATPGEQRMPSEVARNVTESMLDVADSSRLALAGGRPVASKTGTVQSSAEGQNNDAWMVGYTPSVSTAVWVGTDDNSPIRNADGGPIFGRGVPGQIWQSFMNDALDGTPTEQFSDYEPIGTPSAPEPPAPTEPGPDDQASQICVNGTCFPLGPDGGLGDGDDAQAGGPGRDDGSGGSGDDAGGSGDGADRFPGGTGPGGGSGGGSGDGGTGDGGSGDGSDSGGGTGSDGSGSPDDGLSFVRPG